MKLSYEEQGVALRRVLPADTAFLSALFAEVRGPEFAQAGWSQEQLSSFLEHQFQLQDRHYRATYQVADFWLIVARAAGEPTERPVGRIYRSRHSDQKVDRLVEVSITGEFRGRGICTALIRAIQVDAASRQHNVELSVEPGNPALRIYERLGFAVTSQHPIHSEMRWTWCAIAS
jgi:ribosomal protein S18 acetylase RimI-like enzyme